MAAEKDTIFGGLAVERGYVTREQVGEALAAQKAAGEAAGVTMPLGQLMVGKGLLTPDQAQDLRNAVAVQTGEASLVAGYEVLAEIGRGGMGAVYKARKVDSGLFVALKVLLPSLATPDYVERFRRESEVVRKLHHENIVGLVEFGRDDKRKLYFCALEFVEGKDLEKRVKREGALSEEEAVSLTRQVASALQHAHENGLIHRDVKPANIMVTLDGEAKLLDLGLARPVSQEATRLTQSGMFVGSVYYASPEQAKAERGLDIRADIYSLGATLYYMVTGRPPFEGETTLAVLQQHVYEKLQWPAEINPDISESVCLVIAKMMAKEPEDRYQEPIELLRELDALKEGKRPEVGERVMKTSTIARAGALVKKKRRARPASRDRRRPPRKRAAGPDETRTRVPGPARESAEKPTGLMIGLGAAAVLVIVLGLIFKLGGKKEEQPQKLPPVSRRSEGGHDAGVRPSPIVRRRDSPPDVHGTVDTRIVSPDERRDAASAFKSAEDYERAQPKDISGAIARYEAVTKEFPGTIEAGKAKVNVIRLRSIAKRRSVAERMIQPIAPAAKPPGARGLVGHWTFDEGRGTVARDSSGRGNHGKLMNGPTWRKGKIGGALHFEGGKAFVEIPNSPSLENVQEGDFTLAAWFKADSLPQPGTADGAYAIVMKQGWHLGLEYGQDRRLRMGHWLAPGNRHCWVKSRNTCEPGAFHHVTVVVRRSAGALDIYVDGRREGQNGFKPNESAREYGRNPWRIGTGAPGHIRFRMAMHGLIDEVHIYSRALTAAEISALASVGGAQPTLKPPARKVSPRPSAGVAVPLARFDSLMSKGDYADARRYAEAQAAKPANAAHASALKAAARVAKALGERRAAIRRGAEALVGTEATLVTTGGKRTGEVGEVSEEGVVLSVKIRRGRRVMGETRMTVKWSDLTPEQEDRLARKGGWKAEGPEGAVARAFLAMSRGDGAGAAAALDEAEGHPLAEHLARRITATRTQAAYDKAVRRARSHLRAKRWKAAVAACEEALDHRPDDREARALLAEAESHMGPTPTLTLDLGGGVTMEFLFIKPGVFMMGGTEDIDPNHQWWGIEKPKHEVAITRGFYLGKYEVTQSQYEAVMGGNPSKWKEPNRPVEQVTRHEATEFCRLATERTRKQFRLPTEAEWEYACRAGTTTRFSFGDSEGALGEYAWHDKNSNGQTHPVGQKRANAWGLHDMHGNVWEWVADLYDANYYAKSPRENPQGSNSGRDRLLRGGAWNRRDYHCRSAHRDRRAAAGRSANQGFRAAVSASAPGR